MQPPPFLAAGVGEKQEEVVPFCLQVEPFCLLLPMPVNCVESVRSGVPNPHRGLHVTSSYGENRLAWYRSVGRSATDHLDVMCSQASYQFRAARIGIVDEF